MTERLSSVRPTVRPAAPVPICLLSRIPIFVCPPDRLSKILTQTTSLTTPACEQENLCLSADLKDDLGESENLAASQPELAASLRAELHSWRERLKAPLPLPLP